MDEATGTFTDERDGQTYRTVKIGNQVWMAENLRFNIEGSWCYENSEDNCGKYGRLYTWDAAKKACPAGYHLPSREEWKELVDYAGGEDTAGKKLKSKNEWNKNGNGTDDYGFSALPGGYFYGSDFKENSKGGYWWTTSERDGRDAYRWRMFCTGDRVRESYWHKSKSSGLSVRCVKDN